MSCWVAPPIAAEYWRVSLEHVLGRIREGTVPTRVENGFTFVDVLPQAATAALMPPDPSAPPPPTYVVVSSDELAGLAADEAITIDTGPADDGLEHTVDPEEYTPDQQGALPLISWSSARTRAAQTRVAPRRLAA